MKIITTAAHRPRPAALFRSPQFKVRGDDP